jgi:membrane protein YdbS with pleckstrin-like domain
MQPSNHVDTTVGRYSSVSTDELHSGFTPAYVGGPIESGTEEYPAVTVDLSTAPPSAVPDSPADEHQTDEVGATEETLWEGQTSGKSFLVRSLVGQLFTAGWVVLAVATWGFGYSNLTILSDAFGAILLVFWLLTGLKIFRVIHSHNYRLTTRRLFVRTGMLRRRIDQIELLRVKDVFVQQSLLGKWIGVGHVIVISSEQTLPRATLYGIDRPRHVMDLIWLRTIAELDRKTARVEQV